MKKLLITIFTLTVAFLPCFASDILLTDSIRISIACKTVQNPYPADVFYIYPTVCTTKDNTNLCKVNDSQMREAAKSVIKLQAEAFDTVANIYAPFYTQYNFRAFAYSNYEKIQKDTANNVQGLSDIYSALDYYFKNLNQGRPFILVSHSQGSGIMLIVLNDYMKKTP